MRQELIKELKPALKLVYPEVFTGVADLYVFFYARALQLLRPGGMLVFISSNKWFRAGYGAKLRAHIAQTTQVRSITDFGDLPVFQEADAYPMIFLAAKHGLETPVAATEITRWTPVKTLAPPYPDVLKLVTESGQLLPAEALSGSEWTLADAQTAKRLTTMRANGTPLGEYVNGQIFYGVKTGFNAAFVIDGATRLNLVKADAKSAELIKPMAAGRDVKKWTVDLKDKWLIVTKIGMDMKQYPAIMAHLKQWEPQLKARSDQGNHWWELRSCAYYDALDKPKIIVPAFMVQAGYALDSQGVYVCDPAGFIASQDLYLLGVLNSAALWLYFENSTTSVQNGYLRIYLRELTNLPIPNAPDSERAAIAALVQKCLDARGVDCAAWEADINARVAALYGL